MQPGSNPPDHGPPAHGQNPGPREASSYRPEDVEREELPSFAPDAIAREPKGMPAPKFARSRNPEPESEISAPMASEAHPFAAAEPYLPSEPTPAPDPVIPAPTSPAAESPLPNRSEVAAPPSTQSPPPVTRHPLTTEEKVWSLVSVLLLAGLAVVTFVLIRPGLPTESPRRPVSAPSVPIRGKFVTVESAAMTWTFADNAPSRVVKRGIRLIPQLALKVSPESTGALRVFFQDASGAQVGDTVNLSINPGSGQSGLVTTASGGYPDRLEFEHYRARETNQWMVEVHEGPNPQAPASEFTPLFKAYIPWTIAD